MGLSLSAGQAERHVARDRLPVRWRDKYVELADQGALPPIGSVGTEMLYFLNR